MLNLIAIFTLFLFSYLFPVSAKSKDITFNKEQITDTSVQENAPLVNNNMIIYRRHSAPDVDIYRYNLKNKTESLLVQRPGHQSPVALFDKYLLYNEEFASDNVDVRLKNLKTGEDIPVATGAEYQTGGSLWGNKAAYIDGYDCGTLYIFDIIKKTSSQTPYTACQSMKMWGKILVWAQNGNIYGYNIAKNKKFDIATSPDEETMPDIYSGDVVWIVRKVPLEFEIHEKNIHSGKEKTVYSTSDSKVGWPAISNKYLVFVRDEGIGAHNIYVMDRNSEHVIQISNDGIQQVSPTIPDIDNDLTVWMSWHTGNGDIYSAKFN